MIENSNHAPTTGYKALIEQSGAGVYEIQNGEFSYVNDTFADLFGYELAELVGMSPDDIIAEEEHHELEVHREALLSGEIESATAELTGVQKDGGEIFVKASCTVVDRQSTPVFIGFVEDITDEKRRERRFEAIFHNTFQFVGLLELDGTILEANETALYFGGLDRHEVIGEHIWDTYWLQSTEAARETVREGIAHGRNGQQFRDEIHVQGSEGDLIIDFSIRPIVREDGTVTNLVAEGYDITDRKERELERRTIIDRVTDAVVEIDENWYFTLVDDRAEELYGMPEEDLLGEYFWDVFSGGVGTRWETVYREVMETREPATLEEYFTQLGSWYHVEVYPDASGGLAFYFQDITDRKRHEERTAGLNETLSACMDATSKREICDIVTKAAQERLYLPITAIALIGDDGELEPVAQSEGAQSHLQSRDLFDRQNGIAWSVFSTGERMPLDDPSNYLSDSVSVGELVAYPLGRHGVLVAGTPAPDPEFVQTVVENVRRAFDRIDREKHLQDRDVLLKEQNESLNRLNRINNVIRSIDQVLVNASARTEIEQAVCKKLTEGDTYTFAWIGEYDPTADEINPRESEGHKQGYLESLTFGSLNVEHEEPASVAVRTREPIVLNDLLSDPPHEPWREKALRRGYRTVIAIPLTYHESLYGVLTVYSDQPGLFDDMERQVLTELGDMVGHAINSVESKHALVSNSVVELELEMDLPGHPLKMFVQEGEGRTFTFENVVSSVKEQYRAFYHISGASPDEWLEFANRQVTIHDTQFIAEHDGENLFESVVTEESLLFWLVDRSAVPRSLTVTEECAQLTVELPDDSDVRTFVEHLEKKYGNTELVASRERERPARTREEFESAFEERSTARQREVLQTAYFSGYFETPRERTGEEIADSLGVSAPTVSGHIRAGLRNLFGLLYDDTERR